MDRSGEGFTALRSMERSIGDLFAKIEDAKRSTIQAAEQAAVKAASETVARTPGPQSPLAAAMADSKTRETLVAVQETLATAAKHNVSYRVAAFINAVDKIAVCYTDAGITMA